MSDLIKTPEVDANAPLAIGQVVINPQFKTGHIVLQIVDGYEVLLDTGKQQNVELWTRHEPDPVYMARKIQMVVDANDQINDDCASYIKENKELRIQVKDLQRITESQQLRINKHDEMVERVRAAEGEVTRLTISHGNQISKLEQANKQLEADLAIERNKKLADQNVSHQLKTTQEELAQIKNDFDDVRASLQMYRSRYEAIMNTESRIKSQDSAIQFVTRKDFVDSAPADNEIAQMLSDGWQIANISYQPTFHREDGEDSDVSHTMRYISFTRTNPVTPAGEDDIEEQIELDQSMDAAIEAALNKPSTGEHIGMLTAPYPANELSFSIHSALGQTLLPAVPIEEVANAGFAPVEGQVES